MIGYLKLKTKSFATKSLGEKEVINKPETEGRLSTLSGKRGARKGLKCRKDREISQPS